MPLVKTPMTAPTTIYKAFPMITPHEASDLVIKGMIGTPRTRQHAAGRDRRGDPRASRRARRPHPRHGVQALPRERRRQGTDGSRDQITPEAIAFAHVMRGVYW